MPAVFVSFLKGIGGYARMKEIKREEREAI